jgi:hypothetical protein
VKDRVEMLFKVSSSRRGLGLLTTTRAGLRLRIHIRVAPDILETLRWPKCDHHPSVAIRGEGVFAAARMLLSMVVR